MNNKSKKIMSIWQLIVGIGLSIIILVSMFLPRIHLSNYKVIDITEDVAKTILQKMDKATNWISDYIGDYDIDDVVDQIETQMDNVRDKVDYRETSMNSVKIISAKDGQYAKLISGLRDGSESNELYDEIKDSFNGIGKKMLALRILIAVIIFSQIGMIVVLLFTFLRKKKNYMAVISALISFGIICATNVLWYVVTPIVACNKLMNDVKKVDIWNTGVVEEIINNKRSTFYPICMKVWFQLTGIGGYLLLICGFLMLVFAILLLFGKEESIESSIGYGEDINNCWSDPKSVRMNSQWSIQHCDDSNNQWKPQTAASDINQWRMEQGAANTIPTQKNGGLEVLNGCMAGAKLEIVPGEQIIVGRDPAVSELVLMNAKVSRKHFVMKFEAQKDGYQIFCYSKNGLLLSDGRTIREKQTAFVKRGTVIILADGAEQLRLR